MGLHPQAKALLQVFESRGIPPIEQQSLSEARAAFVQMSKVLNRTVSVHSVEDKMIPGYQNDIMIRIYRPNDSMNIPTLVYFHGGGWVIGDVESYDGLCRTLADQSQCAVISVDYSLAPEAKFPIAIEDAYLATKWVSEHSEALGLDSSRIAVGGDSAGGNLAAVVCKLANERKYPDIKLQLLFYPSTGFEITDSFVKYSKGYYLERETMEYFRNQYLNSDLDTINPLAAPILISDEETAQLPPAYIVTAEFDPLCDGGMQYAQKLKHAGVDVTYTCYSGMIHGFMSMTEPLDEGKRAVLEAAVFLNNQFSISMIND